MRWRGSPVDTSCGARYHSIGLPGASAKWHEYVHPTIGEEIRAIGGGYTTARETTFEVDGREVLYSIVVARVDSSCCGEGGCLYANVIGYVIESDTEAAGAAKTSAIEPIREQETREHMSRELRKREQVHEVRFWEPEE